MISAVCANLAEIVAVPCSNFGKVHIVILTIQVNTEIIKNDEIELFLTLSRDRYLLC